MNLGGYRTSSNVESRGGPGGLVMGGGVGTVVVALIAMFMGVDPRLILGMANSSRPQTSAPVNDDPQTKEMKTFVSKVLATTEDAWSQLMPGGYEPPHLVFFQGQVQSACGMGSAAMGPFYCGEDRNVYIDLKFYDQLRDRLGAPGDFAQAYVIAHEVGHHVQNLQGTLAKVHDLQRRVSKAQANEISVRTELQADFYAGVWGHYAKKRGLLDMGDYEEAITAASAIGDDKLQEQAQGYVVPDSFTHGSSEQRIRWFRKGFETGDPRQGDTFNARNL
jgi:uncharacterized protein